VNPGRNHHTVSPESSFLFDAGYILPLGEVFSLCYWIAVADGERERSKIDGFAEAWQLV